MPVTDKTSLANLALGLLKMDAITLLDPPDAESVAALEAHRTYDTVRRAVLADHTWNFATKRAQLPSMSDAPLFGYGVQYELPSDYLRIVSLGDESNPEKDYKIERRALLCNLTAPIDLIYIRDEEDVALFSAFFIECLVTKWAAAMCYKLTGNRTYAAELEAAYDAKVSDSKSIDGQESPPVQIINNSKWKRAKESMGSLGSLYQGRVVT